MEAEQFINDIPENEAVRAFAGTSHSPEKRGASYRADYAQTMAHDYAVFRKNAEAGGTPAQLDTVFAHYRAGYAGRFREWLRSHSRCISWMITGPAKFPRHRAEKWNQAAHNRMTELVAYRERVLRAMVRELRPDLRPVMAGDADAIERLALKLADLERSQTLMRQANVAIRKHAKAGLEAQVLALAELGFPPARAEGLLQRDACGRIGFPDYALSNNNANIHRVRDRLQHAERMAALPVLDKQGQGVRLEEDPPANRVRLFFAGKPDAEVRGGSNPAAFDGHRAWEPGRPTSITARSRWPAHLWRRAWPGRSSRMPPPMPTRRPPMSHEEAFMPWVNRLPEVGDAALCRRAEVFQLVREAAALERQAVALIAQARAGQAQFLAEVMQRWTVAEIQQAARHVDGADPNFLARAQVQDAPLRQRLFPLDGSHLATEALQAFQSAQVIRQHNLLSTASDDDRRQTLARVIAWWNHAARPVCERLKAA